jgi:hypothetical protein
MIAAAECLELRAIAAGGPWRTTGWAVFLHRMHPPSPKYPSTTISPQSTHSVLAAGGVCALADAAGVGGRFLVENFLSDAECDGLVMAANGFLIRAPVVRHRAVSCRRPCVCLCGACLVTRGCLTVARGGRPLAPCVQTMLGTSHGPPSSRPTPDATPRHRN